MYKKDCEPIAALPPGVVKNPERLHLYPHTAIDLDPTSSLVLEDELHLNFGQFANSIAQAYLKLQPHAVLHVTGNYRLFYNATIQVFAHGQLTLGRGYQNSDSLIACCHKITIGDGAAIARGVYIYDGDHHSILGAEGEILNPPAPILIGKHVWIGVKATILKGVTIGDGAIVAANSVVTHNVPAHCLAAGNPARVIRENVIWK